ncbi:MAG: DUF3368 domain-containing protein [Bacteroidota bacterium]
MLVISDTSPITNLIQIGHLELLKKIYGSVFIPGQVYQELKDYEEHSQILATNDWLIVKKVKDRRAVENLFEYLDLGECEAIVLAKETTADLLIIDERKGRSVAKEQGLEIIGLLGVLAKGKQEGYIEQLKPILDKLIEEIGFRVSKKLYQIILESVGEL